MTQLVLLNGPPGIGKSTLARRYADEHPGVLNLDIDQVRTLIGGWRQRFEAVGAIVRPLAKGMAGIHLAGGHDVLVPRLLCDPREIADFAAIARDNGATFREIVLMDAKENSVQRFARRGEDDWHCFIQDFVARNGGDQLLAATYDRLTAHLPARPGAMVLPSVEGEIEDTYRRLLESLSA